MQVIPARRWPVGIRFFIVRVAEAELALGRHDLLHRVLVNAVPPSFRESLQEISDSHAGQVVDEPTLAAQAYVGDEETETGGEVAKSLAQARAPILQ